ELAAIVLGDWSPLPVQPALEDAPRLESPGRHQRRAPSARKRTATGTLPEAPDRDAEKEDRYSGAQVVTASSLPPSAEARRRWGTSASDEGGGPIDADLHESRGAPTSSRQVPSTNRDVALEAGGATVPRQRVQTPADKPPVLFEAQATGPTT